MHAHMALIDVAVLAFDNVFDRLLDRDDVIVLTVVNQINERRHGRGLAASGRSREENDAVTIAGKPIEDRREI